MKRLINLKRNSFIKNQFNSKPVNVPTKSNQLFKTIKYSYENSISTLFDWYFARKRDTIGNMVFFLCRPGHTHTGLVPETFS